jgi:mono/diheme cytochrome c family protein
MRMTRPAALFVAAVTGTVLSAAQEPPVAPVQGRPAGQGRGGAGQSTREFLGLGRAPEAEVAARGEKLYAAACAFCHGPDARGAQGPSLLRSEIVLHDDKGESIGPVVLNGRPDRGMPPMPSTTAVQIVEIAEYLHLLVERAANRGLYGSLYANSILTGDPKAGEAFFNGAGAAEPVIPQPETSRTSERSIRARPCRIAGCGRRALEGARSRRKRPSRCPPANAWRAGSSASTTSTSRLSMPPERIAPGLAIA